MKEDKKQTAVEWFMEQIGEKQPNGLYVIDTLEDVVNVFAKAKEMEKQQISEAYRSGVEDERYDDEFDNIRLNGKYYNETYEAKEM
jgi:hypothetical protein